MTKLTFSKETKSESSESKVPFENIERGRTRSRRFNSNVDQVNPVKPVNPDYHTVKTVNPDHTRVQPVNPDYHTVKPVNPVTETKIPVSVSYKVNIVRQDEVPSPTRY